jgi:ribosome modulation factor
METNGSPLWHEPDLALAVLRVAAVGSGTLDDCLEHLRQLRRCGQVADLAAESELRTRLEAVQGHLQLVGMLRVDASGRCRITAFGRRILEQRGGEARARGTAPRTDGATAAAPVTPINYQKGYSACLTGTGLAENPYPAEVRAHLDWENGWSQARDDGVA